MRDTMHRRIVQQSNRVGTRLVGKKKRERSSLRVLFRALLLLDDIRPDRGMCHVSLCDRLRETRVSLAPSTLRILTGRKLRVARVDRIG